MGHHQSTQNLHMAQVLLYGLLLRSTRGLAAATPMTDGLGALDGGGDALKDIGAANSGVLLYLNHKFYQAVHILPFLSDTRSLIGQRNVATAKMERSLEPRGIISLGYNEGGGFANNENATAWACQEDSAQVRPGRGCGGKNKSWREQDAKTAPAIGESVFFVLPLPCLLLW